MLTRLLVLGFALSANALVPLPPEIRALGLSDEQLAKLIPGARAPAQPTAAPLVARAPVQAAAQCTLNISWPAASTGEVSQRDLDRRDAFVTKCALCLPPKKQG